MKKLKILVMDETPLKRSATCSILEELGHQVVAQAANGAEAVKLYPVVRPALVMLDVTMPELKAIDAIRQIKIMDNGSKIIVCSGVGQHQMILEAIRSGAGDFVVKPLLKDQIIRAIENSFQRKPFLNRQPSGAAAYNRSVPAYLNS